MSAPPGDRRQAWAEIDLAAIEGNAAFLVELSAPAALCAVVKANGYGHGAVAVSRAALAGGAQWLAVALVEEGVELRQAGIEAPILVLSEPVPLAMVSVVEHGLTPTLYTSIGVQAMVSAARAVRPGPPAVRPGVGLPDGGIPVQIKIDTGMHRVGVGADQAVALAQAVTAAPELDLVGIWTHLAVADEPGNSFSEVQLGRLEAFRQALGEVGIVVPMIHAANSAGALAHPSARLDMVRCGIALYGYPPSEELADQWSARLRPALSLRARVSMVKVVQAGEGISYGLVYRPAEDTVVATVPLGYADGVSRRLGPTGGEVLVGGRRCRLAGTVTMDQVMVDCGPGSDVAVGDEVVFIGSQDGQRIGADEWARRLGTISYEVLCGIGARVPRIPGSGSGPG